MNFQLNTVNTILLLGALQGVILGIILLRTSKRNRLANRILAFILFFFSLSITIHALSHSQNIPFLTDYHPLLIGMGFINIGPLFYLYIQTLTNPDYSLSARKTVHFIPFIFVFVIILPFSLAFPGSSTRLFFQEMVFLLVFVISPIYILISMIKLRRFSKHIRQHFSSVEKIDLKWIKFLVFCLVIIWLASTLIHYFTQRDVGGDYIWIITSLIVYLMGYFGLAQPEIFSGKAPEHFKAMSDKKNKYRKSTLTPDLEEEYYQKLISIMNGKELYLNNDLTLPLLAKELKISTHHLSQVINKKTGHTFYDYINSQRIAKVRDYLTDPEKKHIGIAGIGFDVGFNSLSAFNKAFKKHVHMTPSQFRLSCK